MSDSPPYSLFDIDSAVINRGGPEMFTNQLKKDLGSQFNLVENVGEDSARLVSNIAIASSLAKSAGISSDPIPDLVNSKSDLSLKKPMNKLNVLTCGQWISVRLFDGALDDPMLMVALNLVTDAKQSARYWVFDLSDIDKYTSIFVGFLLGFNYAVSQKGGMIILLWVKDDCLHGPFRGNLMNRFNLARKGHYLVSRPHEK